MSKTKEISEQIIMGNLKSYVIFRLSWLMEIIQIIF